MNLPQRLGRSDPLGRYYTKANVGLLLVSQMPQIAPRRVLDLGAGSGALSRAALQRWASAGLLTVDVDSRASGHLRRTFGSEVQHMHIHADALSSSLPRLLAETANCIDAAVCNPPFVEPTWRPQFNEILEEAGFTSSSPKLRSIDAAALFLAQNLRLISKGATLGIVLPDSLISSTKYRTFRKSLLERYTLKRVVKLTRNAFRNTEALAHIAILSKIGPTDGPIQLSTIADERSSFIDRDSAIDRLDFDYHSSRQSNLPSRYSPLRSIIKELQRGTLSSSEARRQPFPVLHTTHLTDERAGRWCNFCSLTRTMATNTFVRARAGDILLARVGRNLEYKVIGISRGQPIITDSVYRIRVDRTYRRQLLERLTSEEGRQWIASRAYGVGARHLTKTDLLEFPV